MESNLVKCEGKGNWYVTVYQGIAKDTPSELGPFWGHLTIDSKLYVVKNEDGDTILAVPSQNVAFVVNKTN